MSARTWSDSVSRYRLSRLFTAPSKVVSHSYERPRRVLCRILTDLPLLPYRIRSRCSSFRSFTGTCMEKP